MADQLTEYDPALALDSPEAIETFVADVFETADATFIAEALGVVARAQAMAQVAERTQAVALRLTSKPSA